MASSSRVGVITEEERQQLLERYLDIVWIDDVADVKCVRCGRVPIHHYVSNCQHLYCRNCRTVFSDGGQWRCPQCKKCVTELSDQDWQLEDTIYQLTAHCPNKKYGCPYQGQLKTMPGHLRCCKDTREATLLAEFKGITLDNAVNKIVRLTDVMGEMRSVMNELKEKCETQWKQPESWAAGKIEELTDEIKKQKEQLAKLEPLIKDVEDLKAMCETNLNQSETTVNGLAADIKALSHELHEEKKELASVKRILKGIEETESRNSLEMQQLRNQLQQTSVGTQAEQIARLNVTMGYMQSASTDMKEIWEIKWKDTKKHLDKVNKYIREQKKQTVEMKDKESRDALELPQMMSQFQQQCTYTAQNADNLKNLDARIEKLKSETNDLKDKWESNWSDVNKQLDNCQRDQHEQKQQWQEIKDKENNIKTEVEELRCKVEQQETLINTNITQIEGYEVMANGMQVMKMARMTMPHEELKCMTHIYDWDIRDITTNINREFKVKFPLPGYDFGAKVTIQMGSYINFQLIDYKRTKRPIDTKSMPKFTYVFVSQSHDTQGANTTPPRDGIRTRFVQFNDSLGYGEDTDGWSSWHISKFFNPPYRVSNGMKLILYIEPPSIARSYFSNNGILLWRLDNYKERKQMEVDRLIMWQESPYFYTSPNGYRVLIRLYIRSGNLCGRLWYVKGEFDSCLTREFPHRLTVTIFNTDQSKDMVVSQEGAWTINTYFEFETAPQSVFVSKGFIKDDSLLIKAVVEPL